MVQKNIWTGYASTGLRNGIGGRMGYVRNLRKKMTIEWKKIRNLRKKMTVCITADKEFA
jgi:hypothetical protein